MDPIAHASVALMAKPAVPRVRLWVLLAAAPVPGLLFFAFEAAGMEHQAVTHVDFGQDLTYLSAAWPPNDGAVDEPWAIVDRKKP